MKILTINQCADILQYNGHGAHRLATVPAGCTIKHCIHGLAVYVKEA